VKSKWKLLVDDQAGLAGRVFGHITCALKRRESPVKRLKVRRLFQTGGPKRDHLKLRDGMLWRGRGAVVVGVAVALACAACGSNGRKASSAAAVAGESASAGTSGLGLSAATAGGGRATARSGGGQPNAGLAVVTVAQVTQPFTRAARALARMADNICEVVRQGAPAALAGPLTGARIARYVKAANAAAARTVVSLGRLAGQRHSQTLMILAHAYTSLRALYETAGRVARRRLARPAAQHVGEQIEISEHVLTAAAFDAGMPSCGVNGA
jgi:hypothetical protein